MVAQLSEKTPSNEKGKSGKPVERLTTPRRGNNLELRLAYGLWPTRIDRSQLDNALLNTANNARDAMPENGTFIIETANRTLDAPVHSESRSMIAAGRYVQILLTDNGVGMSRDVQGRIFEPFYTTKGSKSGSGRGLRWFTASSARQARELTSKARPASSRPSKSYCQHRIPPRFPKPAMRRRSSRQRRPFLLTRQAASWSTTRMSAPSS